MARSRVVERHVPVEALARAQPGRRWSAGTGRSRWSGTRCRCGRPGRRGTAALDELDVVAHLGELGGGLRACHAAADDDDGVVALGVAHRVRGSVRIRDRRVDDAGGLVGDRGDVVAVHPAAALADVGDLQLEAARRELLEAARGEVRRNSRRRPADGRRRLPSARASAPGRRGCTSGCRGSRRRVARAARAGRSRCCRACRRTRRGAPSGVADVVVPLPLELMLAPPLRSAGGRRPGGTPADPAGAASAFGGRASIRRPGRRGRRCRSPGTSGRRTRWCGTR